MHITVPKRLKKTFEAVALLSAILPSSLLFHTQSLSAQSAQQAAPTRTAENGLEFKPKLLAIDANEGIALADINNDGKIDIVAGRNWYAAPDFTPHALRSIKDWDGWTESNSDFTYDVDGDGWTDVVAGGFLSTQVHWYKNPGAPGLKLGQLWKKNLLVETGQSANEASFLRDIDGDGRPEWIVNSWNAKNPVVAWSFPAFPALGSGAFGVPDKEAASAKPQKHVISPVHNGHGMGFGDVNNDGREDILTKNGWFERPESDIWSSKWKFHPDWKLPAASVPILVRDLDGDGLNDLIWGAGHDYGLYWWQAQGPDKNGKLQFVSHTIDDSYSQPHTMCFADLDGDGQDELITGKRVRAHNGRDPGGGEMPCLYYYKWNKKDIEFTRHVIDQGHIGTGLQIRTADLNGDGTRDIAVAGKTGTYILFNQGKN